MQPSKDKKNPSLSLSLSFLFSFFTIFFIAFTDTGTVLRTLIHITFSIFDYDFSML